MAMAEIQVLLIQKKKQLSTRLSYWQKRIL